MATFKEFVEGAIASMNEMESDPYNEGFDGGPLGKGAASANLLIFLGEQLSEVTDIPEKARPFFENLSELCDMMNSAMFDEDEFGQYELDDMEGRMNAMISRIAKARGILSALLESAKVNNALRDFAQRINEYQEALFVFYEAGINQAPELINDLDDLYDGDGDEDDQEEDEKESEDPQ